MIDALKSRIASLEASNRDTLGLLESKTNAYEKLSQDLSAQHQKSGELRKQIASLEREIEAHQEDTANIDEEKSKLKMLAQDAMERIKSKTALQEHRNLEEVAGLLLKDTGIKTAIIREYLPVMNKLITYSDYRLKQGLR
mgnify:CR=1 FL=1